MWLVGGNLGDTEFQNAVMDLLVLYLDNSKHGSLWSIPFNASSIVDRIYASTSKLSPLRKLTIEYFATCFEGGVMRNLIISSCKEFLIDLEELYAANRNTVWPEPDIQRFRLNEGHEIPPDRSLAIVRLSTRMTHETPKFLDAASTPIDQNSVETNTSAALEKGSPSDGSMEETSPSTNRTGVDVGEHKDRPGDFEFLPKVEKTAVAAMFEQLEING